jgi:ribosomal protein S18 acetylase RimI-like enzyme
MASGVSIEILDLRHFAAPALFPVLEAEIAQWRERLHWDYRASSGLLMQYINNRMLPGYVILEADRPVGYAFCVYEGNKAIIGNVYALPDFSSGTKSASGDAAGKVCSPYEVEDTLLRHLLEMLVNSPQVDRIESQLLLQPSGFHADIFRAANFQIYRRFFMARSLENWRDSPVMLPAGLELHPWCDEHLNAASSLIAASYCDHPDSVINDQYRTVYGSRRFLNNIVHYSGCGVFSAKVSHVVIERASRRLVALVLGSRVSAESGHITQICVHPDFRRRGIARTLLTLATSCFLRQGVSGVSLTVTKANSSAIELYGSEGFERIHSFDATVWQRPYPPGEHLD